MSDRRPDEQIRGIPDALRDAVERTFAATAGSASETRERAAELLDEVTKRGSGAINEVTRRSSGAIDEVSRRGGEAMGDAVSALRKEVEALARRLAELEDKAKPKG